MANDVFIMDNGGGYHTRLWRREIKRFGRSTFIWCDAPPGKKAVLRFEDDEGRPVDSFGLPLFGEFIYGVVEKIY